MSRFLIIPICVAIAGCATPGTEPDPTEVVQASGSAQASEAVQANNSPDDDALANNDPDMLANSGPAEKSIGIEELEAPQVTETPPSMIPGIGEPEPAVVCERVVPTGSILPTKVCRSRAEIERKEEADQEIFDDIKRNTAIFNSRL